MTTTQMQAAIENKIQTIISVGYSRKEAEDMMNKALALVKSGKKKITDVIDLA